MKHALKHLPDAQIFELDMEDYDYDPETAHPDYIRDDIEAGWLFEEIRRMGFDPTVLVDLNHYATTLRVFLLLSNKDHAMRLKLSLPLTPPEE